MGEILPDGSIQGYFNTCEYCGEEIEVNIQGNSSHICVEQIKKKAEESHLKDLPFNPLTKESLIKDGLLDEYVEWFGNPDGKSWEEYLKDKGLK